MTQQMGPIGLLLAWGWVAFAASQPQDYIIDTFDDFSSEAAWRRWWGSAQQEYVLDFSQDANGSPNSGSLMAIITFDLQAYPGDNQFALLRDFPNGDVLDGSKYLALAFDIRWDPQSPKRPSGDYGYLEYGFRLTDWSQIWLGGTNVTEEFTQGWKHIEVPIDPATPKIDQLAGVVFKMWAGGNDGLTGQTVFWLDNVKLIANPNPQIPPPKLSLSRATPGLLLCASAPGQQWQRQSIRTVLDKGDGTSRDFRWVHRGQPVSFSLTIRSFPGPEYSGFQAHLFLVPDLDLPYGPDDASIDWNAPHVVFFQITSDNQGQGIGRFMYKVNEPSGNSMLWNTNAADGPVGTLLILTNSTPIGTWTVTFQDDTHVQVTAPDGTQGEAVIPQKDLSYFDHPLFAYFGIQPNHLDYIGLSAVFGKIQITGVPDPIQDDFSQASLNDNLWKVVAADPNGIQVIPSEAQWQLGWSLPDVGFQMEVTTNLITGPWTPLDLITNAMTCGKQRMIFLPPSDLPEGNQAFFRMVRSEEEGGEGP